MMNNLILLPDPTVFVEYPFTGNRKNKGTATYDLGINGTPTFINTTNMPYGGQTAATFAAASYFTGSADFKSKLETMTNFTIEFFIKATTAPTLDAIFRWQNALVAWEIHLNTNSADPYGVSLRRYSGAWVAAGTTGILSVGKWYHVGCTLNGNIGKVYINNVERASGVIDTYTLANITTTIIGSDTNSFVHGYLSDFKISNIVKTKFPSAGLG